VVLGVLLVLSADLLSWPWAIIVAAVVTVGTLLGLLWISRMPELVPQATLSKPAE
jgi:hypothetical protein